MTAGKLRGMVGGYTRMVRVKPEAKWVKCPKTQKPSGTIWGVSMSHSAASEQLTVRDANLAHRLPNDSLIESRKHAVRQD